MPTSPSFKGNKGGLRAGKGGENNDKGGLRAGKGKLGGKMGGKLGSKSGGKVGVLPKPKAKATIQRPPGVVKATIQPTPKVQAMIQRPPGWVRATILPKPKVQAAIQRPPGRVKATIQPKPKVKAKAAKDTTGAGGLAPGQAASSQGWGVRSQGGEASSQSRPRGPPQWFVQARDRTNFSTFSPEEGLMGLVLRVTGNGCHHRPIIEVLQKACVSVLKGEGAGGFDAELTRTWDESSDLREIRCEFAGQWGTAYAQRILCPSTMKTVNIQKRALKKADWKIGFPEFPGGPQVFTTKVNAYLARLNVPFHLRVDKRFPRFGWLSLGDWEVSNRGAEEASGRTYAEDPQAQADELTEVRRLEAHVLAASTMLTIMHEERGAPRRAAWLRACRRHHPDKNPHDPHFYHEVFVQLMQYKDHGDLEAGE